MHAHTQYTRECSCTHMHMYTHTHTHTHTYIHAYRLTRVHTCAHHKYITCNSRTLSHITPGAHPHTHTHTHTHTLMCLFPLISPSLSKPYPLCIPPTFGNKLRHSRSGARGRYNMHVTKAHVLDLGLCYIHTKFHSFILGTSGGNSGLSFILKMGLCISNIFPCLTKFGKQLELGPCYIQVFNSYI